MNARLKSSPLLLVGAGKMGFALLSQWLENAILEPRDISILELQPSNELQSLVAHHQLELNPPIESLSLRTFSAVVLAIKPQNMNETLDSLASRLDSSSLYLSIAAGRTVTSIAKHLPESAHIVRAMPNLPASVGQGITALFANHDVSDHLKELSAKLMEAVGEVVFVEDEELLDAVTAVSGSGPAYVFYLIECLAKAGEQAGLSSEMSYQLARATISGAGWMVGMTGEDAAQLREKVTSKGGTTEAALQILMKEDGLQTLISRAVRAAIERAKKL